LVNSWFVIVNPRAGGGKGEVDWPLIKGLLTKEGIAFGFALTEHKHHAVELTVKAINSGYRQLIAVGGDGTLNEVVNGIFIQQSVPPAEILVGVIGVGTGNDWFRMYEIPYRYADSVKAIKNRKVFYQDVGVVEYYESSVKHKRYFVNTAGIGFDAEVALRTNRLKDLGRHGFLLYLTSILRALFSYKTTRINVNVDGRHLQDKIFSITLGICRYNGAGMLQVPFAISDDGMLDVTVIRRISKLDALTSIPRLYNGKILKHSRVTGLRGQIVEIMSIPSTNLEADGESLGETPLRFSILTRAIGVVVAENFDAKDNCPSVNQEKQTISAV
jgi:YegS/Rv2252/BmrU family lipid kinase